MGCCGDRRRQAATWPSTTSTTQVHSVTHLIERPVAGETVRLRYHGDAPVIFTGPASRRQYHIAARGQEVAADRRDASALVATGRFSRAVLEPSRPAFRERYRKVTRQFTIA